MSRINTNIPSMVAARTLGAQNTRLTTSLQRLSTGLRINTGKDDPAGLIASENLRAEKQAISAAMTNIARANNIIAVAEGGLDEVSKLLTDLEDLVDRSANEAGISTDERNANQAQIDSILDSINRIANSTEFQGKKLLSGDLAYTTSNVDSNNFASVSITSARIPNDGYKNVVVEVTQSAQLGRLTYAGSAINNAITIEVQGNLGTEIFSFASGTAIGDIATAVNQSAALTGVSAVAFSATGLRFNTTSYGSAQFVSVRALDGTFNLTGDSGAATRDTGRDAAVLINGTTAQVEGLTVRLQTSTLSLELEMDDSFGTALGSDTFQITGGGADFMISPTVSLNGLASVGIQSVSTAGLGNAGIGYLSSLGSGQDNDLASGNFSTAQRIIREAQNQVASLRGRLGSFQKSTLEPTSNSLAITLENTTAAESIIRDTDFASETANLTRSQILVQSATNVLRLANQTPQNVLALLA